MKIRSMIVGLIGVYLCLLSSISYASDFDRWRLLYKIGEDETEASEMLEWVEMYIDPLTFGSNMKDFKNHNSENIAYEADVWIKQLSKHKEIEGVGDLRRHMKLRMNILPIKIEMKILKNIFTLEGKTKEYPPDLEFREVVPDTMEESIAFAIFNYDMKRDEK